MSTVQPRDSDELGRRHAATRAKISSGHGTDQRGRVAHVCGEERRGVVNEGIEAALERSEHRIRLLLRELATRDGLIELRLRLRGEEAL